MAGDTKVIFAGPATVWVAPVGEALPEVDDLAPPAVTITPAGNWTEVEFVAESVGISATAEFQFVRVAASDLPVKSFKQTEELEVTFQSQDLGVDALAQFHSVMTLGTPISAAADQTAQSIVGIGDGANKEFTMLIILTNQDTADRIIHLYKVQCSSDLEMKYGKEHESWDVGFTVLADLTKSSGETAGKIYDITAVATS